MAEQNPENKDGNALQKMMNSGNAGQAPPPGGKPAAPPKKGAGVLDSTVQRLFSDLNNLTRRIRLLEERFVDSRKKVELIEENSLQGDKDLNIQNKAILEELSDMKKNISEMKEKMNIMIKELQGCAKLTDVQVLEKYINMWEPINYVTFESMEKNVEHLIDAKMNDLNLKLQQEKFIRREIERQLQEAGLTQKKEEPIKNESPVVKEEDTKPDEVEEINNEIQDMFKKKNETNGTDVPEVEESKQEDPETFEDKKSSLEDQL